MNNSTFMTILTLTQLIEWEKRFVNALIYPIGYAFIETIYRTIKHKLYGDSQFIRTTKEQFIITLLWSPIIDICMFESIYWTAVVFPINIWLCELIFGYILLKYFKTRAWYYDDTFALFDGNISLAYCIHWIILGIVLHYYQQYPIDIF